MPKPKLTERTEELALGIGGSSKAKDPESVAGKARKNLQKLTGLGEEAPNYIKDKKAITPEDAKELSKEVSDDSARQQKIGKMAESFIRAGNRQGFDGYDSQYPVFRGRGLDPDAPPGPPAPNPPGDGQPDATDPYASWSIGGQGGSGQFPRGNYPWLQGQGQQNYGQQGYGQGGGFSPFPGFGQDLGFGMNPWDVTWGSQGGQYAPQLDPTTLAGMWGLNQFVGGGMGLGGAQDYLNQTLSGKWLDPATNPWLAQFQESTGKIKENEDTLARQRIGSAMAAGGNALSGARLASEQQYQNMSDANYQKMIAEQMMQNLARERALQQGAVGLSGNLANTLMGGYGQQIQAGMIPTQLENQNLQRQYEDWVRTTGNMYNDVTQGGKLFQDLMSGRYQWPAQPQDYTNSAAEGLLGMLTGGGQGGLLGKLLEGLGLGKPGSSKGGGTQGGLGGGPGGGGKQQTTDKNGKQPGQPGYIPTYSSGGSDQDIMDYLSGLGLGSDEISSMLQGFQEGGGNAYIDESGNLSYEDPGGQTWTYDPYDNSFVPGDSPVAGSDWQDIWGYQGPGNDFTDFYGDWDTGGATDNTNWDDYMAEGWT